MNILGMGPMEIVLIVVLALIVFGPAKLPEIMGQVGRAIADFRRATSQLSDEFNRTIQAELQETRAVVEDTKSAVTGVHSTINAALSGTPAPALTTPPASVPAPAPNGVSNGTNGTTENKPALADNAQWSWETAAPAPAAPAVQVAEPEPVVSVAEPEPPSLEPAAPRPSRSRKSTGRDDLLPPY